MQMETALKVLLLHLQLRLKFVDENDLSVPLTVSFDFICFAYYSLVSHSFLFLLTWQGMASIKPITAS